MQNSKRKVGESSLRLLVRALNRIRHSDETNLFTKATRSKADLFLLAMSTSILQALTETLSRTRLKCSRDEKQWKKGVDYFIL